MRTRERALREAVAAQLRAAADRIHPPTLTSTDVRNAWRDREIAPGVSRCPEGENGCRN